jgi:hypothetical protein
MTTHVGTGLFCLVRFIKRFFREVFFRAAIYKRRIDFFRFLSVGVPIQRKHCRISAPQTLR